MRVTERPHPPVPPWWAGPEFTCPNCRCGFTLDEMDGMTEKVRLIGDVGRNGNAEFIGMECPECGNDLLIDRHWVPQPEPDSTEEEVSEAAKVLARAGAEKKRESEKEGKQEKAA